MAVTTQYSTELTNLRSGKKNAGVSYGGVLRKYNFTFTQSGVGESGSVANLIVVPPGRCEVILALSFANWSAGGTGVTMDVGYASYVGTDGVTVVADENAFDDDVDIAATGLAFLGSDMVAPTAKKILFNSRDGVTLLATFGVGVPANLTLTGWFVISN